MPPLNPPWTVQDGARLDTVMNGFCGGGQSVPLLMSVFLIHLLHLILPVPYLLVIRSVRTSRKELIDNGSVRLSMLLYSCGYVSHWWADS